jgi:prevent-host-death family protein
MGKHVRTWSMQDAKARLSEVIRLAQTEGPQLVTIHGKATVMVEAVHGDDQPKVKRTGKDLWDALSAGPPFDLELEPRPMHSPSRDFSFEED